MPAQTFLTLINGARRLISAIQSSSGAGDDGKIPALDNTGKLDITFMPNGVGADVFQGPASESLAAGPVNIFSDGGTMKVRKADATTAGKEADGFVTEAFDADDPATVYLDGTMTGLSALTAGTKYFLSTTAGGVTSTAPSSDGNVVQELGKAISTSAIIYEPSDPIILGDS